MAKLGKKPIPIPEKVQVEIKNGNISVTGEKGHLSCPIPSEIDISLHNNQLLLTKKVEAKKKKAYQKADSLQGLMRKLILNMFQGVQSGFEKILEIHGVGYKAEVRGKTIVFTLGFSHPVILEIPDGLSVEILKNTIIYVRGINKELVGDFAAKIRAIHPPEPYKGTGIRYRGEYVRQKVGKAAVGVTK